MNWKKGSCHCQKIQFEVFDSFKKATICDCSICNMKGFIHLIVKKENFKLTTNTQELSNYQFGTKTAKHLFCPNCGISSYYAPRSHPDGYSVNLRCIEDIDISSVELINFEGKKWEENIAILKNHLDEVKDLK
ncbi:MAG: GFA family protein [Bacteriovoracaceae bacterium]|jgi:hypothetical protein|nr:GFA family protein [Bacteriovoracaceae bacterium]